MGCTKYSAYIFLRNQFLDEVYTAVCIHSRVGVFHTSLDRFSMLDISTAVGIVPVPKRSALETFWRELSEDVSFGVGTSVVVE